MKKVKFVLSVAAHTYIKLLKEALAFPHNLSHPHYSLQFYLYCDASFVGAMLIQKERPIAFTLIILNEADRRHSISERGNMGRICRRER